MQYLAPTGVRRYERPRAITLAALGVVVSGSVAMVSPASTAPATQNAFIAAPVPAGQAVTTSEIPSLPALVVTTRTAGRASRAATPRVTTTTVWSDRSSVRSGNAVHFTGLVTYGTSSLPVPSDLVNLQVKAASTWKTLESRLASGDGSVVFTVAPTKSSTYRLAYSGVRALAGSVSAVKTVTVTSPSPSPSPSSSPSSSSSRSSSSTGTSTSSSRSSSSSSSSSTSGGSSSGGYSAVTSGTGRGAQVVAAAAAQAGKPYRYGAAGPDAFDCSGLTQYAFKSVGISLPHSANSQKSYGTAVSAANARPGDLIIFLSGGNGYHAAIYAGGGYMYDAPNSGSTVGKHKIYSGTVIFRRLV